LLIIGMNCTTDTAVDYGTAVSGVCGEAIDAVRAV
jgi:hypothetical protein